MSKHISIFTLNIVSDIDKKLKDVRKVKLNEDHPDTKCITCYVLLELFILNHSIIFQHNKGWDRKQKKRLSNSIFVLIPWNISAAGISNLRLLQLKMSISTGIGEVNNKVISQALWISVSGCKGSIQQGSSWLIMIESHRLLHKLRVWMSNHRADYFLSCARGAWQRNFD